MSDTPVQACPDCGSTTDGTHYVICVRRECLLDGEVLDVNRECKFANTLLNRDAIQVTPSYSASRRVSKRYVATCISVQGIRRIDVTTEFDYFREPPAWTPATVNWPAFGSVPVEVAREFHDALTWALAEAARFNALTKDLKGELEIA